MPSGGVPDIAVRVNGANLPPPAQSDLRSVTIEEDLDALSMFTLELYNWDDERLQVSWSDSALFAVGNEVEISLGYVDDVHKLMVAEITGLEPTFTVDQPPMLTVRGYDHRHRLARGRKTRTFVKMKDSVIAGQVAREAGLRAQVNDTKISLDYVMQSNQSDWEFLQQRARLLGYEVYIQEKVLYYRPPQNAGRAALRLSLGQEITEFIPRLRSLGQVGEVTVRGWDVAQKQPIVGKAAAGQESTVMGGKASGPRAVNRAFGKTTAASVNQPVRSAAEGSQRALGRFNAMALTYIQGEFSCHGQPQLRAGTVVDIAGAGKVFSGPYYVTAATHTVTAGQGYQTSCTVQRNAA